MKPKTQMIEELDLFSTQTSSDAADAQAESKVYTVTEITRAIKGSLEREFASIWLAGEVSNLARPRSGHVYLTLKDANSQIRAVIFRHVASWLRFNLEDGMEVVVFGKVTVYEPRGDYQIIVEKVQPKGMGALQLAFQQLKEKLEKEGLFDPGRKRPIPAMPRKIAIVTSPTGAAVQDMLNIINRRFPHVHILLFPVKVQGDGAAGEIAGAIGDLNRLYPDTDVMIVGRGGGSLEDLWAFNEEVVARGIYASKIPVISAVGHEIDVTISDLVADKRALTPSEAGELVVPRLDLILENLGEMKVRLAQSLLNKLAAAKDRLESIAKSYVFRQPYDRIRQRQQRLDELSQRLSLSIKRTLQKERERMSAQSARLETLNPLKVLARGYSITAKAEDGHVVTDASELNVGQRVRTKLHKGSLVSSVVEVKEE